MAMHLTEGLWKAYTDMGVASIQEDVALAPRLRELVIVRVAYRENSDYELFHHLSIARANGVTEEEIEALKTGDYGKLAANERALLNFVDGVFAGSPNDAALADMRAHFTDTQTLETTLFVGHYMATARIIAVTGCENDDNPVSTWWKCR
jgi:alkylhydroperoxidase family enzyme